MQPRAILLAALSQLAACPFFGIGGDDGGGPGGVQMGGDFELDPSCELDDMLEVELGDGSEGFVALGEGQSPTTHHGPQGGTHMWLGVRIGNLALDRYEMVRVTTGMFDPAQCEPLGEPCETPAAWHTGQWVLGDDEHLDAIDEHTIEQAELTAVFDIHGQELVLQAWVEDPCGQVGLAQQRFVADD
ncbi:MAG TPA: hypothetical protein VG755_14625 [Nannocystaceae bacterium]|nr:hypothetical protein [Nannocystaceae bacterium]